MTREVVVTIGEDEIAGTPEEEADSETEIETDNGDVQSSEKGAAGSTPGGEGTSEGPTKTTTAVVVVAAVGEGGVTSSRQTRNLRACNCSLAARTQGVATQKGTAGEDH